MAGVTVYQPDAPCNQCHATKLHLTREGIPFQSVTADDAVITRYRNEGHASFPVVVVEIDGQQLMTWSGYRRDEIRRLADVIR